MRIAIWALACVACNSSKQRAVEESVPAIVVAAPQVKTVNVIAAWIPLLDRKDGLYERRLALAARHKISDLAKASGHPAQDDLSPTAMLQRTISKAVLCLPLPIHEDTDSYCRDAIAALRTHLAEARNRTPEDQLLTLDKPDPAAKKHADELSALAAPGPKAKAWNAVKANTTADPATFDASCAAAGDEWKAKYDSDKAYRALVDSSDFTDGFRECRETKNAARLVKMIESDKHCPDGMWDASRQADLIPKRFAAAIAAEAKACTDRYK